MLPPGPGVTKANFDRIDLGMTRTDVDAILGRPSDVFTATNCGLRLLQDCTVCEWSACDEGATLDFDEHGCLFHKRWHAPRQPRETLFTKIVQWIPETWLPPRPPIPGR